MITFSYKLIVKPWCFQMTFDESTPVEQFFMSNLVFVLSISINLKFIGQNKLLIPSDITISFDQII